MKILIYSANFAPDLTGIGKYSGDMASWLSDQGHHVRAVAAPPYYPKWTLDERYSTRRYKRETLNGIEIWRAPLWVPAKPTGLTRILHLMSFALTSVPLMLRQVFWRPDVVLTVAPAFVCAPMGWLTARVAGAKAWLHLQDFEVDVAFRMGMLNGGFIKRVVEGFERFMLLRFDRVSTISHRMVELLVRKGVPKGSTLFFPNWVDTRSISPDSSGHSYRRMLGIPKNAIVVLFSGTLGAKQGLMVLPQVAARLADRKDIVFVICGDGLLRPQLETCATRLPNLRLLPLQPVERLGELLSMADIHVLPQSPSAADLVMPSKLTGMLASGRPVIATCEEGTEMANVVSHCGVVVPPENEAALTRAVLELVDDPATRLTLGRRARVWAESNLERHEVLRRVFDRFQPAAPRKPAVSPAQAQAQALAAAALNLRRERAEAIRPESRSPDVARNRVNAAAPKPLPSQLTVVQKRMTANVMQPIAVTPTRVQPLVAQTVAAPSVAPQRVAVREARPEEIEDLTVPNLKALDLSKMHADELLPELGDMEITKPEIERHAG